MGFKIWLSPGIEECYHEVIEKGSRIYFMFEILNIDTQKDNIIAYLRNSYDGNIIAFSKSAQHGHFDFTMNETSKNNRRIHLDI